MGTRAALVVAVVIAATTTATAQDGGDSIVIDRPAEEDLYLAGRSVAVRAPAAGDVVAAAQSIRLDGTVAGDAILAGERVVVRGGVSDDVRAVGRTVHIGAPISGHVVAAGETVVIDRGATVQDWAWLAGNRVDVLGTVGSLRAAGEIVTIRGEVAGEAEVAAEDIRLAPGAIVRGDLRWSGAHAPQIGEGALVQGNIVRVGEAPAEPTGARVMGALFWIASLVIAALLLFLALPRFSAEVAQSARTSPWRCIGAGLAVLVVVPLVIALSFLTGVLWIVGVVLLAAYLLALVAGAILGILAAGDLVLDLARRSETAPSRRQRVLATVLAALVVGALALVPVLGPIVLLVMTVIGIGATAVSLWGMRGRPATVEVVTAEPSPA